MADGKWTPDEIARIRKADPSLDEAGAAAVLDKVAGRTSGPPSGKATDAESSQMIGTILQGPSKVWEAVKHDFTQPEAVGGIAGLGAALLALRAGNPGPLQAALARMTGAGLGAGAGALTEGRSPWLPILMGAVTTGVGEATAWLQGLVRAFKGAGRLQPDDVADLRTTLNTVLRDAPEGGPPSVQFPPGTPLEVVEAFTQSLGKRGASGLSKTADAQFKSALDRADQMTQGTYLEFPTIGRTVDAKGVASVRPMTLRQAVDRASALATEGMDEGVKRAGPAATFALVERAGLNKEIDSVLRGAGHAEAADLLVAARASMARHGGVERVLADAPGGVAAGTNPLTTEGTVDMRALQLRLRELVQSGELDPQMVPLLQAMAHRGGPVSIADQPGVFVPPFTSIGPTGPRLGMNWADILRGRRPTFAGNPAIVQPPSAIPRDAILSTLGQTILRNAFQDAP